MKLTSFNQTPFEHPTHIQSLQGTNTLTDFCPCSLTFRKRSFMSGKCVPSIQCSDQPPRHEVELIIQHVSFIQLVLVFMLMVR